MTIMLKLHKYVNNYQVEVCDQKSGMKAVGIYLALLPYDFASDTMNCCMVPSRRYYHGILIESMEKGAALKIHHEQLKRLAFNQERSYDEISKREV